MPLVQVNVRFAQLLPGAYAVAGSVARQGIALQQAQIQDRAAGIVNHEVFIAVAAAANGWAHARVDDALQSFGRLLRGLAQFDLGRRFGLHCRPSEGCGCDATSHSADRCE